MSKENKLLLIEEKYNLFDDFYNGIPVWNIIREVLFFECHAASQGRETGLPDFHLLSHEDVPYMKEYEDYYLNPNNVSSHDVIFLTHARKVMFQDGYYQPIVDPIFEIISKKNDCIILEEPSYVCEIRNAPQHYKPNSNHVYFTDIYEHECIDKTEANPSEVKAISEKVSHFVSIFEKELNIKVSETIYNRLVQRVLFFRFTEERIIELLRKVKPKYVIAHFFPSAFKVLFVYTCKKLGVPVFELQHGFVSKDFPCEHHVLNNDKLQIKSDVYLSYGDLSVCKDHFSHKINDIVNIGFAYLDIQKEKLNYIKSVQGQSKRKQILVISQPISSVAFMELCDKIHDLVGNDYNVIYKQHPLDSTEPRFRNKDIIVKSGKDSIYDIYSEVDVVVGASSTAMFEAVYLGIPCIVTGFIEGSHELYPIMKQICGITILEDADDIGKSLTTIQMPDDSINKFYTTFSENKLFEAINGHIG